MKRVLIEVIVTNQCNKRCEYCDLDFRSEFISDENINALLSFIKQASTQTEYIHLNFFGWEPVLWFQKIKRIVEAIDVKNIKYSIGTNGNLLTPEILDFLYSYNFSINLSVDNITGLKNIPQIDSKYQENIQINFINDPDYIFSSENIFYEIQEAGFKNINFMPVFSTKKWSRENIIFLWKLYKKICQYDDLNILAFGYFNGIASDIQFVLDTDGYLYNDLDSLLWLQKQYDKLDTSLKEKINTQTKWYHINTDLSAEKLLSQYNAREVVDLVMEIPKSQGYTKDYELIKQIFENVK